MGKEHEWTGMVASRPYRRVGVVSVEEVLANAGRHVRVAGQSLSCQSWRIYLYAAKGVTCVHCGKQGMFFAAEKTKDQLTPKCHLNLYHINKAGKETMITVDHIVPKSKGGGNEMSNLQPLCIECNGRKGNTISEDKSAAGKQRKAL